MKIMRDKTYEILMDKVKRADSFIEALQKNKVYTKPIEIEGNTGVSGCWFIGTNADNGCALLTILSK